MLCYSDSGAPGIKEIFEPFPDIVSGNMKKQKGRFVKSGFESIRNFLSYERRCQADKKEKEERRIKA